MKPPRDLIGEVQACRRCFGEGRILVIPITGKMNYWQNCPSCNRNGRLKFVKAAKSKP